MKCVFALNDKDNPPGKLADAEALVIVDLGFDVLGRPVEETKPDTDDNDLIALVVSISMANQAKHQRSCACPRCCPDCNSPLTNRTITPSGDPAYCDTCDREVLN